MTQANRAVWDFSEQHDRFWSWVATNPHLADVAAIKERDISALEALAASGKPSHGKVVLLKFVLSVWSGHAWECGRFDVQELGSLDGSNQAWVAAWFRRPEFP